ncbi:hypothetical protein H2248_005195 [Termitomyces sp. 'cryptogamus']|nr:hypothetical protein H2248_005195 [Termitomyces sp. 'cryptogamus']
MALYLCVDCGGSKTSAAICDATGTILARATGGPSNFAYLPPAQSLAAIDSTINAALLACSCPAPFAAASLGISGVDSPAAIASITPALSSLLAIPPGPNLHIANDTHLLASPVLTHPDISHAVAVIAGTGAIAVSFRQHPDGSIEELARVGGWGWILGDEGGGFGVGRETVRQILAQWDRASVVGGESQSQLVESPLTRRVLETFGVTSVPEILRAVHLPDEGVDRLPREKRLSSLAPLVFEAAFGDSDPLALRILRTCAGHLAEQVAVLLGVEGAQRAVKAQESVVCFGGSLVAIERYRALVLDDLKQRGHVFRYVEFVDDPAAVGAKGLVAAVKLAAHDGK